MRPLVLSLLLFITCTVVGQADTSYQLLWYAGKKIKPNVLLTPKGDTVIYNPAKGEIKVVSKNGPGKKFDNMLAELNKTPQRAQQMVNRLSRMPKIMLPYYALTVRGAYNDIKNEYSSILSNSITLPDAALHIAPPIAGKGGFTDMYVQDEYEETIKEFRQYYIDHANDDLRNVPEPPSYDYSYCYSCDNAKQDAFKKALDRFQEELTGTDKDMFQKALTLSRNAQLSLTSEEKLRRVMKETQMMINYVMDRTAIRVTALIDKYIDDPAKTGDGLACYITDRQDAPADGHGRYATP